MKTAEAMKVKISKYSFEVGSQKYFRGNALNMRLGTFGEKKDPAGAKSYVDPEATVDADKLAKRITSPPAIVNIDWSDTTKADLEAEGPLTALGLSGQIEANVSYEKVKSGKMALAHFVINEGPLQTMLNTDADGARKYLANEGNDGRIASEVWVLLTFELSEHVSTSGSISFAADGSSVKVTASGGKYKTQTFSITPGTTFAYALHKVKDWNKDKTKIENMEKDWKGIG